MGWSEQVLVSCEHASNELPEGMSLPEPLRRAHIAWDPGALAVARLLADHFRAPLWQGSVSRLVVDLNRSIGNRMLIRRVSDGHRIAFNARLEEAERRRRIDRYYQPYRAGVEAAARGILAAQGRCLHLCVHTFTPVLAGRVRRNDIGLLHDPRRGPERRLSREVRRRLDGRTPWVTWFNRPYSGTADGILPALRRSIGDERYIGLEIEINQRHADGPALQEIAWALCEAIEECADLPA